MGSGGGGRGMGRGAPGATGRGFSNRTGGVAGTASKADEKSGAAPVKVTPVTQAPVAKPQLERDVAEALGVGAVVVARLAESFERVTDVAKARAILDAIPRLVPAGAAHLPIAAAIREVVQPLLGGRFADAAADRVAVLRLLYSEISYLLSKAPEFSNDEPDGRRGDSRRGGRGPGGRGRDRDGGRDRGREEHRRD